MLVFSLLFLLCCEPPLPILPGATLPQWPVNRDSPRHQRLVSRRQTQCMYTNAECHNPKENNNIEGKNSVCKCVGEMQTCSEKALVKGYFVSSVRPTGVTLSAIWDHLIKGYQMWVQRAASISWDCRSGAERDGSSITHDNQVQFKRSL